MSQELIKSGWEATGFKINLEKRKVTLDEYRSEINNVINRAKQNQIDIIGITIDNLPVQEQAISEICLDSIQNIQNILYFRCMSYLLALAFDDWMSIQDELAIFESVIKNIFSNIKHKKFSKNLPKRIPSFINTRWYSHFQGLHLIFEQRENYFFFFKKPTKAMLKGQKDVGNMQGFIQKQFSKEIPLIILIFQQW